MKKKLADKMTNKEFLVSLLLEHCPDVDMKTVSVGFSIVNDYLQTEEQLKKQLEIQLDTFTHPFGSESYVLCDVVAHIMNNLKGGGRIGRFYHRNMSCLGEKYDKHQDEQKNDIYDEVYEVVEKYKNQKRGAK